MTLNKQLATNVKTFRVARGLTQEQLAAAAECHRGTIVNIELGRRPHRHILREVARALGVDASDLEHAEGLRLVRRDAGSAP